MKVTGRLNRGWRSVAEHGPKWVSFEEFEMHRIRKDVTGTGD